MQSKTSPREFIQSMLDNKENGLRMVREQFRLYDATYKQEERILMKDIDMLEKYLRETEEVAEDTSASAEEEARKISKREFSELTERQKADIRFILGDANFCGR